MKARLSARLQSIIDSICGQGCQHVRQFIQQLQQGKLDEKTKSLNDGIAVNHVGLQTTLD